LTHYISACLKIIRQKSLHFVYNFHIEWRRIVNLHNTWAIRPYDYNIAQLIREGLGVSPVTSRLLAARGIDSIEEAGRFLYDGPGQLGDPFIMKGMTKAVKRIGQAISNKEKMVIYGDYDVDGICSTVLLKECLALMGHDVDYYVPDRFSEGYGLNPRAVERLAAKGCKLLLTVDCGITSVEEVDLAQSLGMDVIVTDHHTPALVQPSAVAIVNPRNDDDRSVEHLAGVGVAYKLACALMKDIKPQRASQFIWLPWPGSRHCSY
jgi:single-stranded-DNA-specific exonuclease